MSSHPPLPALAQLDQQIRALMDRPDQLQHRLREVRQGLQALQSSHAAALDEHLAALWSAGNAASRRLVLEPLIEGLAVGPLLAEALVRCVEQADDRSANAALALLSGEVEPSAAQWRRLGQVARRQRQDLLPDVDAVQLLARRGPPEALATVALTAFRQGPEDADDRLVSIAALGRFDDPRVLGWLQALARSGSASLEVLQAVAQAMALGRATGPVQGPWAALLIALARGPHGVDALLRWSAIDGLCHLCGSEALPAVLAAHRAGGEDLPSGYLQGLAARAIALEPSLAKGGAEGLAAAAAALAGGDPWPAVPGRNARALSRDARVARQAAFEEPRPAAEVLQQRAGHEATLVARQQLVGTLLPAAPPSPLPEAFEANWRCLTQAERGALLTQEAAWLGEDAPPQADRPA